MKKLLTFLTLLTLFFGVGWANTITVEMTGYAGGTSNSYVTSATSSTVGGVSFTANNYNPSTGQVRGSNTSSTTNFYIYNTSAIPGSITKIELTLSSESTGYFRNKTYIATGTSSQADVSDKNSATAGTISTDTKTITWNFNVNDGITYFKLFSPEKYTSGSAIGASLIITYEGGTEVQTVKTPTFSPVAGTYTSAQNVEINCETSGATIYYTVDGTTPTTSSSVYSSAISVNETKTIKAIAVKSGMNNSDVAEATYTINITPSNWNSATFVAGTDVGTSSAQNNTDQIVKDNVTFYSDNAALATATYRLYSGSTTTFSVPVGYKIVKIEFVGTESSRPLTGLSTETGTYTATELSGTWTGESQSVAFTASAQVRASQITVYYTSSGSPSVSDLYIVGQVNGLSAWSATKAVKMTYDGSKYTAKFYVTGEENSALNNQDQGTHGGTFAFTTKIGSWDNVNGNRYEPPFADEEGRDKNWWLGTSGATNSGQLYKKNYNNSFLIPAGLYEIEVDKDITTFNLKNIKDLTPAFDPASGDVNVGSSTTLATAEDFNAFIASCNAFEGTDANVTVVTPEVKLYINNTEASTYEFKTAGEVTLTGKAALVAGGTEYTSETATATFTAVQKYSATIASGITGGSVAFNAAGTQTTLNNLTEGYEVRVYVTEGNNYELTTLTYTAEGSTTPVEITTNAGDYYTFNMPAANVTINATFTYNGPVMTTTYEKITSLTDLEVNKKYLIVNEAGPYAYAGISKYGEEITITNGTTEIGSDSGVNQMTLSEGLTNGTYIFSFPYSGTTYYLTYSGTGSNSVSSTSSANGATAWEIDFDTNGNAKITDGGNYLRAYTSGGDFRVYSSQSNQTIQLYKEVGVNAPTFSIAGGSFLNSEYPDGINVELTCSTDGATIYYSTDGEKFSEYSNPPIHVTSTTTISAYATKDGKQSNTVSATYNFVDYIIADVVFSPASGEYYHDQTCQMFTTTKGARIYYTTDGSEPKMNEGTTQLYTGEIPMTAGNTYNFKAVAYIGTTSGSVASADYIINTGDYPGTYNYLYSIAELNAHETSTSFWTMVNPVQVIWMSTYQNNGTTPEFCLVRDNTGYGMIYFAKGNTYHNGYKIFQMGDWIPGAYYGPISWAYSQNHGQLDTHPELGDSYTNNARIRNWPSSAISNSTVLPEYLTIPEILLSGTEGNTDYWGHYVHLRKTTVQLVANTDDDALPSGQDKDGKWSGTITDENGNKINYYDKFYLQIDKGWTIDNNMFKGHPNRTFDIYGFVACHIPSDPDYQISPFDFAWIDKPTCSHVTGNYTSEQTVSLSSPEDPTATIWYKTSDMDDYRVYTGPFTVNSTTTVEWYATKPSLYNDEIESVGGSITMTFIELPVPVISPESQVNPIAENSYVDAEIAFAATATVPEGTVIYYTTDGSDPKTSENVYVAGTTELHFTTTTTVRAIAKLGDVYSAEADAKTYTFVKSNGIIYDLVTNVNQLTSNGVYVIVSRVNAEAMSNVQNETNRGAAGVMFVPETDTPNYHGEEQSIYGNDDVAVFTVTPLSHEGDTDPLKRFLFQTNNGKNSASTGYLYVGSETNNTLLTEATEDELGNDVAVVTIDDDGRAHIRFNYAGGDNRYLQYWNRDRLFNTYKSEYEDRAVYIYYKNATPLATIEKEGVPNGQYTIADQLLAVYADVAKGMLWCKDQGNVSIAKTEKQEGQIDFMKEITKEQTTDWDQSNWVVLQFDEPTLGSELETLLTNAPGKYIKPATISGTYSDVNNYTITMADQTLQLEDDGENYVKNLYCTANFLPKNLNINGGQGAAGIYHGEDAFYFFMNPKVQEVCEITYAEWAGENIFIAPLPSATNPIQNDSKIDGAFTVAWTYNVTNKAPVLTPGAAYRFLAVVQRTEGSNYLKANEPGRVPSSDFIVYPLNLDGGAGNIVTGINKIDVDGSREVKSVKYVNVAGMVSDKPFSGVNIVVTEYTDGSRSTTKMLRK